MTVPVELVKVTSWMLDWLVSQSPGTPLYEVRCVSMSGTWVLPCISKLRNVQFLAWQMPAPPPLGGLAGGEASSDSESSSTLSVVADDILGGDAPDHFNSTGILTDGADCDTFSIWKV